jgi:apolipoprotein N-acyltransferase
MDFPLPLAVVLLGYAGLLWAVVGVAAWLAWRWPPVWGALGLAAAAVLVEWVDYSAFPMWGTAQTFTRVWSAAPWAVQFVLLTGPTGVAFVLFALQALAVRAWLEPGGRRRALAALAVVLALVSAVDAWGWSRAPVGSVKVAAVGWDWQHGAQAETETTRQRLDRLYLPAFREAVTAGARLIVTPETGVLVANSGERDSLLAELGGFARKHGLVLVVGVGDWDTNQNRAFLVGPDGAVAADYVKTHLIWGLERWDAGPGTVAAAQVAGASLGAMICQDDNFTDLLRAHGRAGTQVMAVPTDDWPQVAPYHAENSLFPALEGGFGVVRAARAGVSLVADARGRVLARRDHLLEGHGLVLADLPLYAPGTPYAWGGEWLPLACVLFLGLVAWLRRRAGRKGTSTLPGALLQ